MDDKIIAVLAPSIARRILATASTGGLGIVILWIAANGTGNSLPLLLGLLVLAAASLGMAVLVWRATAGVLELTDEVVRERDGRVLCRLDEIKAIEKSLLSWKPAGGFAIVVQEPGPMIWVPGLWWRMGRRIMIGGSTNGGEAKAMADLLLAELARQQQQPT